MKASCKRFLDEQFNNDAEVVGEIYAEYVASLQEKLGELAASVDAADWDLLDRLAHTVKGNALVAGDTETADTAIALRRAAKLQQEAEARQLVARLRELSAEL